MRILLAGMHYVPNQFTRGIQNLGCVWKHWHGERGNLPTDCDAVVIARCQIGHTPFWQAKEAYLEMKKPIFVSNHSFAEIAEPLTNWLKDVGHLDELGRPKKQPEEKRKLETAMARAFQQAQAPLPKEEPKQEEPVSVTRPEFEQIRSVVNKMIQEEHAKERTWKDIADTLNKHNLVTPAGLPWSSATAPAYALKHNLVGRRMNTSAGPVGSTGPSNPDNRQPRNSEPKTRVTRKSSRVQLTEQELEEIMTSNLRTGLKLHVIKLLVQENQ